MAVQDIVVPDLDTECGIFHPVANPKANSTVVFPLMSLNTVLLLLPAVATTEYLSRAILSVVSKTAVPEESNIFNP